MGHEQSHEDERREIGRASKIMAVFTLLSRVLGLARNLILSHFFGATYIADAFIAAFTIPNALRRLFGEGALTPAFVTTLTRAVQDSEDQKNPEIWKSYFRHSFTWLTIFLLIVCGLGMLFAGPIVHIYVPEFKDVPGKMELTVSLTRYLFPFILFIGWAAFFMGVLNTFRSFGLPAFGPSILNLSVIILVPLTFFFVSSDSPYAIYVYGGAFLVGGFLQALIQIPKMLSFGARPRWSLAFGDPRVIELGKILIPSAFAMGVYQLNIIVNRIFASGMEGAVSHLFFADLILELPISLIATSLGTAVLPSFSRLMAKDDKKGLANSFAYSLEGVWLLSLPAMVGMIALAQPIVSTLYLSGKFNLNDLENVSACLIAYGMGLPFFAGMRILTPVFFAAKDTKTPAIVGLVALFINLISAWQLSSLFGAWGIALATSISSAANFGILTILINKRHPDFEWKKIVGVSLRIFLAALIMGLALHYLVQLMDFSMWRVRGVSMLKITSLTGLILLGVFIYAVAAKFLKLTHLNQVLKFKKRT